jgi:hypothetical protein
VHGLFTFLVCRVALLLIAGLAIALFFPSERSKSSSDLPAVLFDSNVDLATLPPDLQMKALHGGPGRAESRSQGRAKYDDLLADGPLGTATSTSSSQSLDLETLSPKAQIRALASANSPSNSQSQQSASQQSAKKKDDVKLGSNIGLDGSIHLLRSARQIIAERLARAHGISPTVQRAVEAAVSSSTSRPPPHRDNAPAGHLESQERQQDSSQSSDEEEQKPAQLSAEAKLKAEEARLRSSVADLERRAADTEVSDDQGLLGGPAPPSDV